MKFTLTWITIASFICAGMALVKGAPLVFFCLCAMGGLAFAARIIKESNP